MIHEKCGKEFDNGCRCFVPTMTNFMNETIEVLLSLPKMEIDGKPTSMSHLIDEIFLVSYNGNIFTLNGPTNMLSNTAINGEPIHHIPPSYVPFTGTMFCRHQAYTTKSTVDLISGYMWANIIRCLNTSMAYDNTYAASYERGPMFGGWITFKGTNKFLRRVVKNSESIERWELVTR